MKTLPRKTVSVVFPSLWHVAEVDDIAKQLGERRSTFVRRAVAERIRLKRKAIDER